MLKLKEIIKILEKNGYFFKRGSKHLIYSNGKLTIAVPHHQSLSIGLCRRLLQQANLKHEIFF